MKKKRIWILVFIVCIILNINLTSYADKFYFDIFGHWAIDTIMWATNEVELFSGYEDRTFRPDNPISRAEYVTLLYRTAKKNDVIQNEKDIQKDKGYIYTDLNEKFWAYNEILTIAQYLDNHDTKVKFNKIFDGDKFKPNKNITREEAVVLLSVFTTPPIEEKKIDFEDIDSDYKYYDEIKKLVSNGIINGYEDNTFRPEDNITRAEASKIFKEFYSDMKLLSSNYIKEFQLIDNPNYKRYLLFGDYNNKDFTDEDFLYARAESTLEYKSIVHYIPYEEKHLYDPEPIKTLMKLRDSGYWNVVGTNYYLLKYGNLNEDKKEELYYELLTDYINRKDLDNYESIKIFENIDYRISDSEILIKALDKWQKTATSIESRYNAVSLKSKVLFKSDQIEEALYLLNKQILSTSSYKEVDPDIKKTIIFNKVYILYETNKLSEAMKTLEKGLRDTNNRYDKEFKGAMKQILVKADNMNIEIDRENNKSEENLILKPNIETEDGNSEEEIMEETEY
ncbi:S-layer homology domain-containing protein [Dethiothermospora halolimnae]|uniref:S-layer homology domain-containing protein n=1 Tax=Dethiothermospora halolimnae TaxID=3114390 RepID=UPI003CCBDA72